MTKLLACFSMVLALSAGAGALRATEESPASPEAVAIEGEGEGDDPAAATITPPDVYQLVALLRAEIDLIRLEMGKREVLPPPIHVSDAAPREVYFQALTLFRKADRLAFEHTQEQVKPLPEPEGEILPADVYAMVEIALDRVEGVKQSLGIVELSERPAAETGVEHAQVFHAILSANREINSLLDRQFSPSDVFQEVTLAIAYMARLLDTPRQVTTPPDPPPYERRKRPADVYHKLIDCFDEIRKIGDTVGVPMLSLRADDERIDGVEPSDVYDVASVLVAELVHLHRQRERAGAPRKIVNPGRKVPSDVYQRLGILHDQLEELQLEVESNPGWLED